MDHEGLYQSLPEFKQNQLSSKGILLHCYYLFRCKPGSLEDFKEPCFPILRSRTEDKGCLAFARSIPQCRPKFKPREQLNELTSFLDLSQVYGSEEELAKRLRTNDGKCSQLANEEVNF